MHRNFAGLASCFGEPLSLLSVGVSVGAFANERGRCARGPKELVREASVSSRNDLARLVDDVQQLQGDVVDLESVVNKAPPGGVPWLGGSLCGSGS